ncbi:MAG: hypothetical protein ABII09_12575 [Planctomycetota bacterium]
MADLPPFRLWRTSIRGDFITLKRTKEEKSGFSMLDTRCWMLDAGCSILDTGCWMLDA